MALLREASTTLQQRVSHSLRTVGRSVPPWLPRGTAVGNRLLKPIYRKLLGPRFEKVELWPRLHMTVNPCEAMGGNLFFSPQLYDRVEREWLRELLQPDSVFVDVGANLGVYSLWAAQFLSKSGALLAIEADPATFELLRENVAANHVQCSVMLENVGVSDCVEELRFFRSATNAGGNSFFTNRPDTTPWITLQTRPLYDVVAQHGLRGIDLMKIDIEGFELKVLGKFFADCEKQAPTLKPRHLLAEMDEGPRRGDRAYLANLRALLHQHGYATSRPGKNTLFSRA